MNGFCTCREYECSNCGDRERQIDKKNKAARDKRKAVNKLKLSTEETKAVRQWAIRNFNEYEESRCSSLEAQDLNGANDAERERDRYELVNKLCRWALKETEENNAD